MSDSAHPYAILDFPARRDGASQRLAFSAPVEVWRADTIDRVVAVLDEAEHAARAGRWVVGFVSFEASAAFDHAFEPPDTTSLPLAWFAAFAAPDESVSGPDAPSGDDAAVAASELAPSTAMFDERYAESVGRIHAYIDAGDVYQVNLTVPFTAPLGASPRAVYERMRLAQRGLYSCLLDIGGAQILSASPELFFDRQGDRIRSRPMKGTAPRGLHPAADAAARDRLLHSEKERAENVMIVDVVRNDLGRIARVGSVRSDALCHAERYPSVWQLTSTVEAELRAGLALADVFRALFPPASVTGAPKIRATAIIRELEAEPREIYCGTIGVVRPGGNATFNVAIRTAWTTAGSAVLHLNAGGAVTADSTAVAELREVGAKLAAFTQPVARPALFETIRVERGAALRLERHVSRLATSADHFGIPFDREAAIRVLDVAIARAQRADVLRARLELTPSGEIAAHARPYDAAPGSGELPVVLATTPVDRRDVRLYHKCVDRSRYDAALAAAPGAFDVVLWNEKGEVTELTRGNLVVEIGDRRLTPPVDCGLLAGTLRAELLEQGEIEECVLDRDDLRRAHRLWFVNALRGWVPIALAGGVSRPPQP